MKKSDFVKSAKNGCFFVDAIWNMSEENINLLLSENNTNEFKKEEKFRTLQNETLTSLKFKTQNGFIYVDISGSKTVLTEVNGFDIAVKIEKNHGEQTDTFKLAEQFLSDYDKMFKKYADANNPERIDEEKEGDFDEELTELEKLFCDELAECYLKMLREEYEYLTYKPAVIETIEAKEYEFYEDGELY